MKKFLILMLVLGLTSMANAVTITVDGNVELSVGGVTDGVMNTTLVDLLVCETLVIDVHGPADGDYSGIVVIMGDPDPHPTTVGGEWGDELGPPYEPMCSSYYYEVEGYPIVYAAAGDHTGETPLAYAQRYEYDDWGWGYEITAASATSVPGGKQFEFLFHCCLEEDVTIQLYDYWSWNLADTIVVHQIPEPATIALLGLGSMFLMRRRRK